MRRFPRRPTVLIAKSPLFRREAAWRDNRRGLGRTIPEPIRSWLYESASLTARLRRACGADFRVKVLGQDWTRPFAGEAELLGVAPGTACLVREVALLCGGAPQVLARSVIPVATLRRSGRGLARLGSRPLGEVLFACRQLRRLRLQLTRLKPNEFRAMAPDSAVWGRRSLYSIAGGDLLVCEFFLPAVLGLEGAADD